MRLRFPRQPCYYLRGDTEFLSQLFFPFCTYTAGGWVMASKFLVLWIVALQATSAVAEPTYEQWAAQGALLQRTFRFVSAISQSSTRTSILSRRPSRGDGLVADTCSHTAPIAVLCLARGCNHHIWDVNANSNNVTVPSLGQWPEQPPRKKAMYFTRRGTLVLATFLLMAALPPSARAYEMPYDPYPWCAEYWDGRGGSGDCGFLTLEQCRAAVSGVGGSCEPNQFYNPRTSPSQRHRRKPR
jgi:Protein of unknown function (DUF3551)